MSDDGNKIAVSFVFASRLRSGKVRVYSFDSDWIQIGEDIDGINQSFGTMSLFKGGIPNYH